MTEPKNSCTDRCAPDCPGASGILEGHKPMEVEPVEASEEDDEELMEILRGLRAAVEIAGEELEKLKRALEGRR